MEKIPNITSILQNLLSLSSNNDKKDKKKNAPLGRAVVEADGVPHHVPQLAPHLRRHALRHRHRRHPPRLRAGDKQTAFRPPSGSAAAAASTLEHVLLAGGSPSALAAPVRRLGIFSIVQRHAGEHGGVLRCGEGWRGWDVGLVCAPINEPANRGRRRRSSSSTVVMAKKKGMACVPHGAAPRTHRREQKSVGTYVPPTPHIQRSKSHVPPRVRRHSNSPRLPSTDIPAGPPSRYPGLVQELRDLGRLTAACFSDDHDGLFGEN